MKACQVYLTKGAFVIVRLHTSEVGGYIGGEPVVKLERDVPLRDLGQSILDILNVEQLVYKVPVDIKPITAAIARCSGYSSWKAMHRATIASCVLEERDGQLRITPFTIKERGGFSSDRQDIFAHDLTAEAIGRKVVSIFEMP